MTIPTRLIVQTGSFANDGTGDTLRDAGSKINNNFEAIWQSFYDSNGLIDDIAAEQLNFSNVPNSDPSVAGLLWRDSDNDNVLKVSRG